MQASALRSYAALFATRLSLGSGRNAEDVDQFPLTSIEFCATIETDPLLSLADTTLRNAKPENISGFAMKNDAIQWMRYESAAWLHVKPHVLEKKEAAVRRPRLYSVLVSIAPLTSSERTGNNGRGTR